MRRNNHWLTSVIAALVTCCCIAASAMAGDREKSAQFFAGCGTITIGPQGCSLFSSDEGGAYILQDLGGHEPGDHLYVSGTVVFAQPVGCFTTQLPILINVEFQECFEGCGTLVIAPSICVFPPLIPEPTTASIIFPLPFYAIQADAGGLYVLGVSTGEFELGDRIFVTGGLLPGPVGCFPMSDGQILTPVIKECFTGCGTLVEDPLCGGMRFQPDTGGFYSLTDFEDFELGDRVFVTAAVEPFCIIIPECPHGCMTHNTIGACFDECGMFVPPPIGDLCGPHFQADSGGLYLVDTMDFIVEGQHVHVTGEIIDPCFTFPECSVIACVGLAQISECATGAYAGCGTLGIGPQSCTLFHGDDGTNFAVGNTGMFSPGDHVFVTGVINPKSELCFPITLPAIEQNTISECFEACGTLVLSPGPCLMLSTADGNMPIQLPEGTKFGPGDQVYVTGGIGFGGCSPIPETQTIVAATVQECFEGCGTLVQGFECIIFVADSGEQFLLTDTGGFGHGDRLRVTGIVDPDCFSFCFIPCLTPTSLEGIGADLNCDGLVNGRDLGILLASWSQPPDSFGCKGTLPCPADLNGDFLVNGIDLGILLSQWTMSKR